MRAAGVVLAVAIAVVEPATAQVTFERLRSSSSEPGNWLTYSGSYGSWRYTPLDQITPANVANLRVAWVHQAEDPGRPGLMETTPLVDGGVLYTTDPPSTVVAIDTKTGSKIWRWSKRMPDDLRSLGFPPTNRGIALLGDQAFVGTMDGWLYALDAKTGAERWSVQVGDNATGHSITLAPLALDGLVIVGTSGGEAGIRGFIDAYDAETGKLRWRFWTIPGPGEPGHETWTPSSWQHGAGATWLTGSYDADLDLLYWGIGNPGPDWNGDARPGDNLYTCSVLAIEPKTGKLRWHFQFTPHDVHDWDANQIPILLDGEVGGRTRRLLATANRNAFYYLLDRETGEFLHASPYAKQTWADGIDAKGRPKVRPGTEPSVEGTLVWPSLQGATNWFSPSYSPKTNLFYVPVREMGAYYYKGEAEYEAGSYFTGGGERALSGDQASGAIRALDATTGELRWEWKLLTPPWSGVMATAGGLVFGGTQEGHIFALDASSGEPLWSFSTGSPVRTNPMSFTIEGRQHVAMAGGNALFVLGLPETRSSASTPRPALPSSE
ncbi:MAG TPA: PQQ-dependent dehydrogenase, methanol/ethanol family [Thermoanaerobaculia bacterium]|nr:PQQ-dependent dehydrogenase, methanol/ethanol family [Thermoanaerobaculia bacterium]